MPPAVQLLACAFAAAMMYGTYVAYRRRQFGTGGLVLWERIWAGLVFVSLVPGLFQPLARSLRVARLMDLVVVVGMLVLGAVTFRNYVMVQRLHSQLEQLVRAQALADVEPRRPAVPADAEVSPPGS